MPDDAVTAIAPALGWRLLLTIQPGDVRRAIVDAKCVRYPVSDVFERGLQIVSVEALAGGHTGQHYDPAEATRTPVVTGGQGHSGHHALLACGPRSSGPMLATVHRAYGSQRKLYLDMCHVRMIRSSHA